MTSCWLDLEATAESQMSKLMKQQSRAKSKEGKSSLKGKKVNFDDSHQFDADGRCEGDFDAVDSAT